MPSRWMTCPVVTTSDGVRRAKVGIYRDPGTPETPRLVKDSDGTETTVHLRNLYRYSASISSQRPGQVNSWCLCFVKGEDLSPLDADAEIDNLLEQDLTPNMLGETPRSLGWSASRVDRLKERLRDKSVSVDGVGMDTPLWQVVERVGQRVNPAFHPRRTWVR